MKAIFATTQGKLLGLGGTMPWCHHECFAEIGKMDMCYFKEITKEANVVMGYNTWVSMGQKPLKGRKTHYIITRKKGLTHEDSRVRFMDLNTFIKKYVHEENLVCIGGRQIYKALMPYFDEIYWNELRLLDIFYKDVMPKFNDEDKVYISSNLRHVIDYPTKNGFREPTVVMQFDKIGNIITYKRFTKKATP